MLLFFLNCSFFSYFFFFLISEKPSPPQTIEVTEITKESVSLSWIKPEDDGGSRISSYRVDALENGQDKWVKCGVTKTVHFVVYDLKEATQYFFRVRAENHAGFSDAKDMILPVTVKDQHGEFFPSPTFYSEGTKLLSIIQYSTTLCV